MALIKLDLTQDHIELIKHIKFEAFIFPMTDSKPYTRLAWGVDQYNIFGGSFVIEDVARILGRWNERIEGTESDYDGCKFPIEVADYFFTLYQDICENMEYIESILHQFVSIGVKPGKYTCISNINIWEYKG